MKTRWLAPAIVAVVAIAGAHPFCNAMFHCGCGLLSLTAHCNIHNPQPPHCPWCRQPLWFALAGVLALAGASAAMRVVGRRTAALAPAIVAGLGGVIAGGILGAIVARLASA